MRNVELRPAVRKALRKLCRKDPAQYSSVMQKIQEIASSTAHYKRLRYSFKELQRVHVRSYVLIFYLEDDWVVFVEYEHHDDVYKR